MGVLDKNVLVAAIVALSVTNCAHGKPMENGKPLIFQ